MSASHNKERLMTVLLGPHVSEKTTDVGERHNQIVFKVRRDSNKTEIRRAVEMMFEVKVADVQVVNCRGKIKRFGQEWGQRQHWKKAYVTLAEGENIDFLGAD
jgi:large subunit ribosomal protein L23